VHTDGHVYGTANGEQRERDATADIDHSLWRGVKFHYRRFKMGLSLSLLLCAAGAVLLWAVDATVAGLNIHTVGVILLVVGIVGFVTSLFFLSSWGGFGAGRDSNTTVVHDRVVEQ
jgi:hypothetical protein